MAVILCQLWAPCHASFLRKLISTVIKKSGFCPYYSRGSSPALMGKNKRLFSIQIFIFQQIMLFVNRMVLPVLLLFRRQPLLPAGSSSVASTDSDRSSPGPHLEKDGGFRVPCSAPFL